jgi:hypothetical protein
MAGGAELAFLLQGRVANPARDIAKRAKKYLVITMRAVQLHRNDPGPVRQGQFCLWVQNYIANFMAKVTVDPFARVAGQVQRAHPSIHGFSRRPF